MPREKLEHGLVWVFLAALVAAGLTVGVLLVGAVLDVPSCEQWTWAGVLALVFAGMLALVHVAPRAPSVAFAFAFTSPAILVMAAGRWRESWALGAFALPLFFLAFPAGYGVACASPRVRAALAKVLFAASMVGAVAALVGAGTTILRPTPEAYVDHFRGPTVPVRFVAQTTRSACHVQLTHDGVVQDLAMEVSDEAGCSIVARLDAAHGLIYVYTETNTGRFVFRRALDAATLEDTQLTPARVSNAVAPWWGWSGTGLLAVLIGALAAARARVRPDLAAREWSLAAAATAILAAPIMGWLLAAISSA